MGEGNSRKIEAETAPPTPLRLASACIRLSVSVSGDSVKAAVGFLRWKAQLRIQDQNWFFPEGALSVFIFPPCFFPFFFFMFVSAKAE